MCVTRLREIRMERAKTAPGAFTLAAIASRLGVTESAVSRWERGINQPTKRHLRALARVFGVTVEELVAPVTTLDETTSAADLRREQAEARRRWAQQSTAAPPSPGPISPSPGRPADRRSGR